MTRRLFAVLVVTWIPVFLGPGILRDAVDLAPVALAGSPYLVPGHAPLLYVAVPAVVLSAFALLLSPGLLLVLALRRGVDLDRWILYGFATSLVLVSAVTAAAQGLAGAPPSGRWFAALVAGLACVAYAALELRTRRSPDAPAVDGLSPGALATYVVPLLALLLVLLPKFLWESLNGDGAHAYEATRLLLHRPLPFWDPEVGLLGRFPGLGTMLFTYPASWFLRLFGELEVSARLPFLLHMGALYAGLVAVARHGREDRVPGIERWLVWAGLVPFALVLAFSATYNPYHADLALPAVQDALMMACLLGFILSFLDGRTGWMALFLALTLTSQASGSMLVALWLVAAGVAMRPVPWRPLARAGALFVLALLALAVAPRVIGAFGLPPPGEEHALTQLIERFEYLWLTDWRRFAFVVVACGIVPAAALFAWGRQDGAARALTLFTAGYFGLFYVQAFVSVHHFVPAMVVPIAVLWRVAPTLDARRAVHAVALGGAAVAVLLAAPLAWGPHVHARTVGSSILDLRDGYERLEAEYFRPLTLYWELFPGPRAAGVPHERYGGPPLAWIHYARREGAADAPGVNYVLQPSVRPAPAGMELVAEGQGAALYLRSRDVWREHAGHLAPVTIAPLFEVPGHTLFRTTAGTNAPGVIDVRGALRRLLGGGERTEGDSPVR